MAYEIYQSRFKGYEIDNAIDKVSTLNQDIDDLKNEYDANKVKMSDGTILPMHLVNTYATKTDIANMADKTQVALDIATATTDMATKTQVASDIATATTDMATKTQVALDIAAATTDMATKTQVAADITAAAYTLPEATTTTLGGVKPDGTTITVDADGTIHSKGGSGGEGTGGGHIILDSDDTPMDQEDNLQFSGFSVTDDSANKKTIVTSTGLTDEDMDDVAPQLPDPNDAVEGLNDEDYEDIFTELPSFRDPFESLVGLIIPFMRTTPPVGYLACDGTIYDIANYKRLANLFKEQFGSANYFGGDGTITFAVPDLRGEFLRGTGANGHTNQGSGSDVGVHQDGTIHPNINIDSGATQMYTPRPILYGANNSDSDVPTWSNGTAKAGRSRFNADANDTYVTGSGGSLMTSRPTNTSVLYCIKY